ncbi:MAG: gfo/Idh/MocA family oxidoreductase, partial [Chloroflexi bacterium]|nr:gfo/Idh/MocA family oxidoreductase [Chloroflexota bacterium]
MALQVGIAGLGGAARQVLPSFKHVPGVELAGVADVRQKALEDFASLGVKTFDSAEAMCD